MDCSGRYNEGHDLAGSVVADQHAERALRTLWLHDPIDAVRRLSMRALAYIVAEGFDASGAPFRFSVADDNGVRFRCPACRHSDHNGGTAELDEIGNRWACRRCKAQGTRYYLERIVLETPEMLDAAAEVEW